MKQKDYIDSLKRELNNHNERIIEQIKKIINLIPEKTNELIFDIHPGQEDDGYFEIYTSLTGPDLFVLNKAIKDVANVFDVQYSTIGFKPPIPKVEPDNIDWDVYVTLCNISMEWLKEIWTANFQDIKIPVLAIVADDFDEIEPLKLN